MDPIADVRQLVTMLGTVYALIFLGYWFLKPLLDGDWWDDENRF